MGGDGMKYTAPLLDASFPPEWINYGCGSTVQNVTDGICIYPAGSWPSSPYTPPYFHGYYLPVSLKGDFDCQVTMRNTNTAIGFLDIVGLSFLNSASGSYAMIGMYDGSAESTVQAFSSWCTDPVIVQAQQPSAVGITQRRLRIKRVGDNLYLMTRDELTQSDWVVSTQCKSTASFDRVMLCKNMYSGNAYWTTNYKNFTLETDWKPSAAHKGIYLSASCQASMGRS
jgi:hypothetical protein